MRTIAAIAITVTLAATPALAQPTDASGLGAASCEDWAQGHRRVHPGLYDSATTPWAQGYMTALNYSFLARGMPEKNLDLISSDWVKARLYRYCDQHPLGRVIDAINQMFKDLPQYKQ